MIHRRAAIGLAALPFAPAWAFPDRSVLIVDGYPAGGGTDIVARRLSRELQRDWARPVIVENRSGANGTLAAIGVARASPDGHTLFMGNINTVVLAPLVLRGVDIRSVQELLGHSDIRTTMIYLQLARAMRGEITSPLDDL